MGECLRRETEVEIRLLNCHDRPGLADLQRELFAEVDSREALERLRSYVAYKDLEQELSGQLDAVFFSLLAGSDHAWALVAERDGRLLGYVLTFIKTDARRVWSRLGAVEQWYVRREERGNGIGRALLQATVEHCRHLRCDAVESSALSRDHRSQSLHHALGFIDVEVRLCQPL